MTCGCNSSEDNAMFTGDTARITATFRGIPVPPATTGDLVDPDGQIVIWTVYDYREEIVATDDDAVRDSLGVYYYDWTALVDPGIYFIELKGVLDGNPQLSRTKIVVRFRPGS